MSGLQFDNKISLGHILTAAVLFVGLVGSYYDLSKSQEALAAEIAQRRAEIAAVTAAHQATDVRLRSVEMLQASQVSDLRNIQSGIARIEGQLDRLTRGQ